MQENQTQGGSEKVLNMNIPGTQLFLCRKKEQQPLFIRLLIHFFKKHLGLLSIY